MTFYAVLGGYLAVLALIVYIARRGFGLLGLALVAGALLAKLWAPDLTPVVASTGLVIVQPPLLSLVAITLTLLPALILLPKAPKVHGRMARSVNALLFALLAGVLTFDAFLAGVVADAQATIVIRSVEQYRPVIVTTGVILAMLDIWATRPNPHHKGEKRK